MWERNNTGKDKIISQKWFVNGKVNSMRAKFWKKRKKNEDDFTYNIINAKVKYIMPNIYPTF